MPARCPRPRSKTEDSCETWPASASGWLRMRRGEGRQAKGGTRAL